MRWTPYLACCALIAAVACGVPAPAPPVAGPTQVACTEVLAAESPAAIAVDAYFAQLAAQGLFNGAVLVAAGDEVVLRRSYQLSGAGPELVTSPCDQFIIASISKLVIKYSVLRLAEEGHLRLDAPLFTFAGGFADEITVQHLLDHQSGLPRELAGVDDVERLTLGEFVELAKQEQLEFAPGSDEKYSNVGYQLLALVISRAAPDGYEDYLRAAVYEPLGMTDTDEYLASPARRLAPAFGTDDAGVWEAKGDADLVQFERLRLYSTVDDLFRFGRGVFDSAHTSAALAQRMLGDKDALQHAGSLAGYRAFLSVSPGDGWSFAFLANIDDIPFLRMTEDLPKVLAGEPYSVPQKPSRKAIAVAAETLRAYEGRYTLDLDPAQWFEVQVEGGELFVLNNEGERDQAFAETPTLFFFDAASSDSMEFAWDEAGGHYSMVLIIEGGMRLETTLVATP